MKWTQDHEEFFGITAEEYKLLLREHGKVMTAREMEWFIKKSVEAMLAFTKPIVNAFQNFVIVFGRWAREMKESDPIWWKAVMDDQRIQRRLQKKRSQGYLPAPLEWVEIGVGTIVPKEETDGRQD